jgi:hypothetical protein
MSAGMKGKSGNQVMPVFKDVCGVECELVNGSYITKRDAQRVIMEKLGVSKRQARAAVSSYSSEGWMERQSAERYRINDGIARVESFINRVCEHAVRSYSASVENGKYGGRPTILNGALVASHRRHSTTDEQQQTDTTNSTE